MTDFAAFETWLDAVASEGRSLRFWLRDDDAVSDTPALDRLLSLMNQHQVPCLLAVIPAGCEQSLVDRLKHEALATVAVHGWAHANYAQAGAKKAELGTDRPTKTVLSELEEGRRVLAERFGPAFRPILVPPWNRIAPEVVDLLPSAGFAVLSVFGPGKRMALPTMNTHVDLIDWRGTRGVRTDAALLADVQTTAEAGISDIGLLTHHLVHDAAAWFFLERFFPVIANHPATRWVSVDEILTEQSR